MSVNIDWMGHRYRVIHANFIDHWDWSDFRQALGKAHMLMGNSDCHVSLIFDFLGSVKATPAEYTRHEQFVPRSSQIMRFVVISEESALTNSLLHLLRGLYPHAEEIVTVRSYEEAFALVQRNSPIAQEARA